MAKPDIRVAVRLDEKEKNRWDDFANSLGLSTSKMVRKAVNHIMGIEKWVSNGKAGNNQELSEIKETLKKLTKNQIELINEQRKQMDILISQSTSKVDEDIELFDYIEAIKEYVENERNYKENGSPVSMFKITKNTKIDKTLVKKALTTSPTFKRKGSGWIISE